MRDFHANLQPTSTVFVRIDLHRRRWPVTARTAEAELFSASIEGTWEALRHVLDRFRGHHVEAVYEAGYFGYWLHNRLAEYGASYQSSYTAVSLIWVHVGDERESLLESSNTSLKRRRVCKGMPFV